MKFKLQRIYSNKKSECSMSTSFEFTYALIQITIVDNPKEEDILRTTVYKTECSEIYFIS